MSTGAIEERLDAIRKGQLAMVQLAQDRLASAIERLLEGDFVTAKDRAGEAFAKLDMLAESHASFYRLSAGATIVRVGDIEPESTIIGWGVVLDVEEFDPPEAGLPFGYKIKWRDMIGNEHERTMSGASELIVYPPGVGIPNGDAG